MDFETMLLDQILPSIRLYVKEALQSEVGTGAVKLVAIANSDSESCKIDESNGDHLTFSIPYAGTAHTWELIFNGQHPEYPPDFLSVSEDFDYSADTYTQVSRSWDITDADCISKLLQKLYQIFKLVQIQKLKDLPLFYEYCRSIVKSGIPEEHIEVYYDSKAKKVNLLVKLTVKAEDLPLNENITYEVAFVGLLLTLGEAGNVISTSLSTTPYLEQVLGPYLEKLPLPNWNDTFNYQFIHTFSEAINRNLKTISNSLICHRHIIATLLNLYPTNVVAFDEYSYSYGTLLFTVDQARYTALFNLNERIELVLFALDKSVDPPDDGCIYIETGDFSIEVSPDHPRFAQDFHENLQDRINKFVVNAVNLG